MKRVGRQQAEVALCGKQKQKYAVFSRTLLRRELPWMVAILLPILPLSPDLVTNLTGIGGRPPARQQLYVESSFRTKFIHLMQQQCRVRLGVAGLLQNGNAIWISENATIRMLLVQTGYEGTVRDITERKRGGGRNCKS